MEVGKLKTVAIILLALVNLSFAAIIVSNRIKTANIQADERAGLVSALDRLGIEISEDAIPGDAQLYEYAIARETNAEALIAASLLGRSEAKDLGGNIYVYETSKGRAQFRGSGNFDINLKYDSLKTSDIITLIASEAEAETDSKYICTYQGIPVFNCRIEIAKTDGETLISGSRLPGTLQNETISSALSMAAILLRFVENIKTEGIVVRSIEQITKGYLLSDTAAELKLRPVWQIVTDGGTYYMDAVEGALIKDI
jgi:hypothetical protein